MKYLLDTNVFRELGKSNPHAHVEAWLATIDDADIAISALTVREVTRGIARLRRAKPGVARLIAERTAAIFDAFEGRIIAIDRIVASAWGEALAITAAHADDAGVAASARVHGLTVVTRNVKDFAKSGASILNPYKSPPELLP